MFGFSLELGHSRLGRAFAVDRPRTIGCTLGRAFAVDRPRCARLHHPERAFEVERLGGGTASATPTRQIALAAAMVTSLLHRLTDGMSPVEKNKYFI